MPKLGESQLRIFNGMPCDYHVMTNVPGHENFTLESLNRFQNQHIAMNQSEIIFNYDMVSMNGESDVFLENIQNFKMLML